MKKTLVALAALAAVGTVSAQSSVTVYGLIDTGFSRYTTEQAAGDVRQSGLSDGNTAFSRLGFRGREDLGGGLRAVFNLELGLNANDGTNSITTNTSNTPAGAIAAGPLVFGRIATVGIGGGWGEVRLGREIHPAYFIHGVYDPFAAVGVAAALSSVQAIDSFIFTGAQLRFSNGITYQLPPNLGGIYGSITYAPSEQLSNAGASRDDGQGLGARLGFTSGPFDISGGFTRIKATVSAAQAAAPVGPVGNGGVVAANTSADRTNYLLGASYDFGILKLQGIYSRLESDAYRFRGDAENDTYQIGVTVPFGSQHILKASYAYSESSGQNSEETNKFGIGYEYRLSKRTALYAQYARTSNKNNGVVGVGPLPTNQGAALNNQGATGFLPTGSVTRANGSANGVDLGIRHSF